MKTGAQEWIDAVRDFRFHESHITELVKYVMPCAGPEVRYVAAPKEQARFHLMFIELAYGDVPDKPLEQFIHSYSVLRDIMANRIMLWKPQDSPPLFFGLLDQLTSESTHFRHDSVVRDALVNAMVVLPGGQKALEDAGYRPPILETKPANPTAGSFPI